jgi:hypothetical protein
MIRVETKYFPSLPDLRHEARTVFKIQTDLGLYNQPVVDEWREKHRDKPGSRAFTWEDLPVILDVGKTTSGRLLGKEVKIKRPRKKK